MSGEAEELAELSNRAFQAKVTKEDGEYDDDENNYTEELKRHQAKMNNIWVYFLTSW